MNDHENCCGATDQGRKRPNNQDAFLVGRLCKSVVVGSNSLGIAPATRLVGDDRGWLMMVADGMGGHAGGERASTLAVRYLVTRLLNNVHWFLQIRAEDERQFIASLKELLRDAHLTIQSEGRRDLALAGMGTTLTMTYMLWPDLYVVHAGDSRCYLIRGDRVHQLTTDHTLARRMVETGGLKPEDEAASRWSSVLWNVLGGQSEEQLKAEVRHIELQYDDLVLLCSDGLHRHLNDSLIRQVLRASDSCGDACQRFIDLANQAGGEDNITVVVAQGPRGPEVDPLASTGDHQPARR